MKNQAPLPAYLPDQSAHSGILLQAKNLYAATDGYRPVPAFESLSDALADPFLGGASFTASDGNSYLLAGTTTGLYRFASGSWTTVVDTLTIAKRWKYAQFGNYALSVNAADTRQVSLTDGTQSIIADAPTAIDICVIGDYVMVAQADGNLLKVQWSAFGDHTSWTDGTDQAGSNIMLTGGAVMGLAGGEYGVVLQRNRLVRVSRTGDSTAPLQFDEITAEFGCAASSTIVQVGRTVFFRSDRGFMALDDGQALRAIGSEKVDRTFDSIVGRDDYERIYTAVDPRNKLVMWGVPGTPGTIWVYNFELDRWTTIELSFSGLFSGFTSSDTLEAVSSTYTDIDTMPYSLDDPRFSGGNPRLYLVSSDYKLGTFNGDNLQAVIETSFAEPVDGAWARLLSVQLIGDMNDGTTVEIDARGRLGDAPNIKSVSTIRASGIMPIRHAGRHMKLKATIAAGTVWSYIQGSEIEYSTGGERQ